MKDGLRTEKEDAASQAIPSNIILINHLVARRMLEELERVLNGQEGDIDINVSVNGLNALHKACELGYVEVVKLLLQHGAGVSIANNGCCCGGETALHRACRNGYAEVVEVLLQHGADPYAKDSKGETSFDITVKMEHNEMLKVLLDHYVECIADSELSLKCLQLKDRILLEHRDLLKKELLEQQALLDDYIRGIGDPTLALECSQLEAQILLKQQVF